MNLYISIDYHINNDNNKNQFKRWKMRHELREKRRDLNLRMIDVALKSGVGVSTIWLIEQGYDQRVSTETKTKIPSVLGTTIEELFGV